MLVFTLKKQVRVFISNIFRNQLTLRISGVAQYPVSCPTMSTAIETTERSRRDKLPECFSHSVGNSFRLQRQRWSAASCC